MIMRKVTILLLNYHKVVGKFIIKGRLKVNIYTYIYISTRVGNFRQGRKPMANRVREL